MKTKLRWMSLLAATVGLAGVTFLVLAGPPPPKHGKLSVTPKNNELVVRLQVEAGTNGATYVIQTSTNLTQWRTLLAVKPAAGEAVTVGNIPATNQQAFFRLMELNIEAETNAPAWTNGVRGSFVLINPGSIRASWAEANDDTGISEYRLYVNGVLVDTVLGSVLSYDFNLNLHARSDLRIQAVDPFGNTTEILSLSYLPGDGLLAVGNDSGRVYRFNLLTNGNFSAAAQVVDFPNNNRGLGLGDFDRDGLLDLVAGYGSGGTMVSFFYKGRGDGTYAPGVALPQAGGANGYMMDGTVGDFDADGNLDYAVNGNEPYTIFYWGKGDGSFEVTVRDFRQGSYYYGRGMAAGDFDEDGREDFARAANSTGQVKAFLSNGDRTFVETNFVAGGLSMGNSDPYGVAAGDFDEDGHLDLLVMGGNNGDVTFLKGFGDGSFTNITGTNGLWANLDINNHSTIDAFDYDGDGHLDLVMAGYSSQAVYFWAGLGDGTFSTNRITVATSLGNVLGISAPPKPPRVDVGLMPLDPSTNLNGTLQFSAVGAGVNASDKFLWSFGDTGTNRVAWMFTNGMANMGQSVTHTYTNEGRFLTRLLHTSSNSIVSARGTWVTISANPPVSVPGGPYVLGETGATQAVWYATLDGSASTDDFGIVTYLWHFGDGSSVTSTVPTVARSWNGRGPWTVGLTVADASGQTHSNFTTVTFVPGALPVAAINGPAVVDETNAVNGVWTTTFYGTNSTDDVGIWKYDWKFGDGKTGSGASPTTTYSAAGVYTVTLTVTDHANQTNSTTHTVTVKANDTPVPVITGNRFLTEAVATNGLWFGSFHGTNSTDDRGIYVYQWNFGDGGTATGPAVTHNYSALGIYPLVLTVTDFGKQTMSVTQNVIVVANDLPVARLTASPLNPEGAQPVNLSAATSSDDFRIMSYRWSLPEVLMTFDGTTLDAGRWVTVNTVQSNRFTSTGQNSWTSAYFYTTGLQVSRGGAIEARVDTSSGTSYAMFGFRNQDNTSGSYERLVYAIYFNNGAVQIYEYGNYRGQPTTYAKGTAYDIRIETKPAGGAIYYLRPAGGGDPFAKIFETSNYSDGSFGVGGTVYAGVFGFDDLRFRPSAGYRDVSLPVAPGGTIELTVTDHALQSNSTSIVINCLTGAPPVAVINGPTNGLVGVELAFDGYNSADDYAIASYMWDFGDGSPNVFGPAVSHHYNDAGTYTNRLTVMDYAGQSSSATRVVTIAGVNLLSAVPWQIIGGIEQPHEVYAGKTNTLKAVVRGVPVPFTYVWTYGDGTGAFTNQVTNSALLYNLEATHAYTGTEGTPYYATIQVLLTNGTILGDVYPLVIRPKTLDTEMKVAIDEGLWNLHKSQSRYDIDTNNVGGYWTANGYSISASASAVHAFGINGHTVTDDASQDPYVDTVQRGVNYLLTTLTTQGIGPQAYGDPDGNHNGIALFGNSGQPIYETGPLMDALVAATRPELVARVGGANVRGRALRDIMQDLVDAYCWGQYDDPTVGGGWRYGWNSHPDNSAAQWGAIGMLAARDLWGIAIPEWVAARNLVWVNYSRRGVGFGYTGQDAAGHGPSGVDASTPSALIQAAFDGVSVTNGLWLHGEGYLANNWGTLMGINNVYAHYAMAKALRTAVPEAVHNFAATGKDWFRDEVNGLARVTLDKQRTDGAWRSTYWVDEPLATAWSVIILTSSLFQRGPVAVVQLAPNPSAVGYPIVFDARSSYHQHPAYKVVEYRWDFDAANGLDFEHPDAVGAVVTNAYGALSTNVVSLQVRDNGSPELRDVASVVVRTTVPPFPPSADAGGPYVACVGQSIQLDGSGSFTVDAASGNFIRSWEWETDLVVPLDFDDGVSGARPVLGSGYPAAGVYGLGLRVRNANSIVYPSFGLPDLTAEDFTSVYVYDRVVTNLAARPKGNKIQLTWTKVGDYAVVHRSSTSPDRGFAEIGRTASDYATFLDTDVEYNVEYFYRIFVYRNGQSEPLGISDPEFIVSRQRGLEDHPPVFVSEPVRIALVGQPYGQSLEARDPENDAFIYNVLSGPTNLTVNPTNGLIDFTPTAGQVGAHAVSFDATNAAGRDVLSFSIFVFPASNTAPVASVNGPYAALTEESIQFSSAGTSDGNGDALYYYWYFGDGQSSTNPNPAHAYAAAGDYLVSLFVNDGYGGTASAQTHAVITRPNRAPTAIIAGGPNFGRRLGEALTLNGVGSFDLDGDPLTFTWVWGDGTGSTNAGTSASHTYAASGTYNGQLIVADNRSGQGVANFTANVGPANQLPVAAFTLSTNSPFVLETVTFDAAGSTDPENDALIYEWDFGDKFKTTGSLVTHAYGTLGDFAAVLKVSDGHGGVALATQTVHVLNAPPVFASQPPLLIRAGSNYNYTPIATDTPGDTLTFDFVQAPVGMTLTTNSGQISWLTGEGNVGPNPVTLRVTDQLGASADQSFTLVVTTPSGPEVDLELTAIVMTNVIVNSQSLQYTGTVHVRWRNNGADPVPIPYTALVFADVDGDGAYSTNADRVLGYGAAAAGLAQGFVVFGDIPLRGEALFAGAPVHVFVDSSGVVPEYNEANNLRRSGFDVNTNNPPVADVTASRLELNRSGLPDSVLLQARLGNAGHVSVPAGVAVSFYLGDPQSGGNLLGVAHSQSNLTVGRFETVSVTWSNPPIAAHTLFVVADDNGSGSGALTEISEANNKFSATADLTVNEVPIADAGPDQTINLGEIAGLNGRDSHDPESKPLTYRWSLVSIPIGSHPQLSGAESAQASLQTDAVGPYTVRLMVNDGVHDSLEDQIVITVVDPNENHPPTITSTPPFSGMTTVPYTYAVVATDPDGDTLRFRLGQGPAGMTINTNTGLIQFTTTNTGSHYVQVIVEDGRGGGYYQGWSLTIQPYQNLAPQFTSTPVATSAPGSNYVYDVDATDPNSDTVTYTLTVKPAGMTINAASGLITWTPTVGQVGGNAVTVTASDGKGGTASQTFNIVVFTPGQDGPVVSAIPDQTVVTPATFALIPLDAYVVDPNNPDSQITWTVTGTSNLSVTIDSNRVATISYTAGTLTSERVTFLATDPSGKAGFASPLLTVRSTDNPPVAALANLSDVDTTVINTGTFELRGTADDPDAIDPVAYRVVLYDPVTGAQVANVTPGPLTPSGWHVGRVAAGGSLGTLDLTLVRNGTYTLMLEVNGGNLIASVTASLSLDTQLKLGQVMFSQQDAVFLVGGVGLQVLRSYDSLNPNAADFGYSWTYSVADIALSINETRVQETDLFGERFSLRTGGGRDITLTMPDSGQRVTFKYSLNPGGLFRLRAAWTPPPGVNASLVPTVSANQIALWGLRYWEAAPMETGLEGFDFPAFILTLGDGTQYRVEREYLGSHFIASDSAIGSYVDAYGKPYLRRITKPDGERTEFIQSNGVLQNIEQYNSANEKLKALTFVRDGQKRITAVYAPENVDTNGTPTGPATMTYEYDTAGNLARANKLQSAVNPLSPVYAATSYLYEHPRFPHFITEVRDDKGVAIMRFEYDAVGRLVATYDAYGNKRGLDYNLTGRTSTSFDALGNPTVYVYDDRGNVVATTDAMGGTTRFTYNGLDQITSITDALGNKRTFTFDGNGVLTAVTDPLGHTTSYTMVSNQFRITDALGRVTVQTFNAAGKVAAVTDAAGNTTALEYDGQGNPTAVINALGQKVAAATFDSQGRFLSSSNYLGLVESAGYDAAGNVTQNSAEWRGFSGTNEPTHAVVGHTYDAAGRKLSDTLPNGTTQHFEYDAAGRRTGYTDVAGNRSTILYNASGKIIETSFSDGSILRNVYDDNGRLTLITDRARRGQLAAGTRYIYDPVGRPTRVERIADVVVNVVTQQNLLRTVVANSGPILSFIQTNYDAASRPIGVVASDGRQLAMEYDAASHCTAITRIESGTTNRVEFEYDALGKVVTARDALGRETRFFYDPVGRKTRTIYADGTSERVSYNPLGLKTNVVDRLGLTRGFDYDAYGHVTQVTLPPVADPEQGGAVVSPQHRFTYDDFGHIEAMVDPLGRTNRFGYSTNGLQESHTLPGGEQSRTTYDSQERILTTTDFNGVTTENVYNGAGQLAEKLFYHLASGSATQRVQYAYDATGRRLQLTDARGTTAYAYDNRGRPVRIQSPEADVQYDYDPVTGLFAGVRTGNSENRYSYDDSGRLTGVTVVKRQGQVLTAPETTSYEYNLTGMRSLVRRPNGVTTSYSYDDRDQLTQLVNRDAGSNVISSFSYAYRADGKRTAATEVMRDSAGVRYTNTFSYAYDSQGRVTNEVATSSGNSAGYRAGYVYDLVGNRLARTVTVGGKVLQTTYEYDVNNRLLSESNSVSAGRSAGLIPVHTRDAHGMARVEFRSPPSAWTYYAVQSVPYVLGVSFLLLPILLLPLRQAGRAGIRRPQLLPRHPLWITSVSGYLVVAMVLLPMDWRAVAAEADLFTSLNTDTWGLNGSVTTYEYDANGAVTRKSVTGPKAETVEYGYNFQQRLAASTNTVVSGGHTTATTMHYAYNDEGMRVRQTRQVSVDGVPGTSVDTFFTLDIFTPSAVEQVMEELPAIGAVPTRSYTHGLDIIAQTGSADPTATQYLIADGHRSTRQVASAAGVVQACYSYDAYGLMLGGAPTPETPALTAYLYGGESFDAQQQQYYLRARYYDPANGRFTSQDPIFASLFNPQALHKYQYCGGDPVNNLDPTGLFTVAEMCTASAILSVLIGISANVFSGWLQKLSPYFPDAVLIGASGTIKGLFATPAAGLLLSYAGVDVSGGALALSSLFSVNASIPFAAAGTKFMQYSMLVVGFELVYSMASGQGGAFFYFGEQLGTPSNSVSVYAGLVWNMWNEDDYTGFFASFGIGAGDYGAALFFDPTDGKPIGDAFTFFSKSDGAPLSAFGNVTYYWELYEEDYPHQTYVIAAWASIAAIVAGAVSKNAVAMLCTGILGIGTGYLWYKVKELPSVHGSDRGAAAYQFYLDQRQNYKRPDDWDVGKPEPNGGLTRIP